MGRNHWHNRDGDLGSMGAGRRLLENGGQLGASGKAKAQNGKAAVP